MSFQSSLSLSQLKRTTPDIINACRANFNARGWGAATHPVFRLLLAAWQQGRSTEQILLGWRLKYGAYRDEDYKAVALQGKTHVLPPLSRLVKKLRVLLETDLDTADSSTDQMAWITKHLCFCLGEDGATASRLPNVDFVTHMSDCLTELLKVLDEIAWRYVHLTLQKNKPFTVDGSVMYIQSTVHAIKSFLGAPEVVAWAKNLDACPVSEYGGDWQPAAASVAVAKQEPNAEDKHYIDSLFTEKKQSPAKKHEKVARAFGTGAANGAADKSIVPNNAIALGALPLPPSVDFKVSSECKICIAKGTLVNSNMIVSVLVRARDIIKGASTKGLPCWLHHKFSRKLLPRGGQLCYHRAFCLASGAKNGEIRFLNKKSSSDSNLTAEEKKFESDLGIVYPCPIIEQWYNKFFLREPYKKNDSIGQTYNQKIWTERYEDET